MTTGSKVSEPGRLVMTVPGDAVTAITLTPAPNGTTQIAYAFDVDESMPATQFAVLPGTSHIGITGRADMLMTMIPPFLDAP